MVGEESPVAAVSTGKIMKDLGGSLQWWAMKESASGVSHLSVNGAHISAVGNTMTAKRNRLIELRKAQGT